MKHSTRFLLLVAVVIAVVYCFRPKHSRTADQGPRVTAAAPAIALNASVSIDRSMAAIRRHRVRSGVNSLAACLRTLHFKLGQWQESQTHDPDDEDGRDQLLAEMLGMVTDENAVTVVQSLSTEELNTPFGIGALHHWTQMDPVAATDWLAMRPDSTKEQILAVAEDWTGSPDGLQRYLDQLPQSEWKQNFLEQAGSAALSANPAESIKLAGQMNSGDAQTNLLRAAANEWISVDPNAALDWIGKVSDPSLREQLIASAAESYALTDPSQAMTWLASEVKSTATAKDAACNILETWVSTDPAAAANWVSTIPDADFKITASKIVLGHWGQTDPAAATAWARNLAAN